VSLGRTGRPAVPSLKRSTDQADFANDVAELEAEAGGPNGSIQSKSKDRS
jgi:hypothetical protein